MNQEREADGEQYRLASTVQPFMWAVKLDRRWRGMLDRHNGVRLNVKASNSREWGIILVR